MKVPKPYSPGGGAIFSQTESNILSSQEVPVAPLCTNFGTVLPQPQYEQEHPHWNTIKIQGDYKLYC